jgi:uncharacterized protein
VTQVGKVIEIRRYPVKSMLGEVIEEAAVTERGLEGDRVHGLFDPETGRVVSVKRPERWRRLFEFTASTGAGGVQVRFPDGRTYATDDPDFTAAASEFFGRPVELVTVPIPQRAIFDEAWMSELNAGAPPPGDQQPRGPEGIVDGGGSYGVDGGLFNYGAVHLLTTGAVRALAEAKPDSRFDAYRFRPNIVIDTDETGFAETGWQGRTLDVGEVTFEMEFTVPRCVMTTLAQAGLPADRDVLRTITRLNRVELIGHLYPCLGIYGKAKSSGTIRVGDTVTID